MTLKLRHVRLRALTDDGMFGADIPFSDGLFVLRADNTRGKSTSLNAIIYALGLEGMWSSGRDVPLPHVMTDKLADGTAEYPVIASEVLLEIANGQGEILTIRRPVKGDQSRNLVSTWNGPVLTEPNVTPEQVDYYVREPGAAVRAAGFHHRLAQFLGWTLPAVARYQGDDVPLYMETLFPLLFVEQKNGWGKVGLRFPTHLGIREMSRRAIEFILALDVNRIDAEKRQLRAEETELTAAWKGAVASLERLVQPIGGSVQGVPSVPVAVWPPPVPPKAIVRQGDHWVDLMTIIKSQGLELKTLTATPVPTAGTDAEGAASSLRDREQQLASLEAVASGALSDMETERAEVDVIRLRIESLTEDLKKNRDALKLSKLGSVQKMKVAQHTCPTCHQRVSDILLPQVLERYSMPVEDNIAFLDEQERMATAMLADSERRLAAKEQALAAIRQDADELRVGIRSLRTTLTAASETPSVAAVEHRVRLEENVRQLKRVSEEFEIQLASFEVLAKAFGSVLGRRAQLPREMLSSQDNAKLNMLEKAFVKYVSEFGVTSVNPATLSVSRDTYRPVYEGFDLEFDFSASDTIRSIWAYLLALMYVGTRFASNHPGLLVLDEPRQQSTARESLGAFLRIAGEVASGGRQIVIATSEEPSVLRGLLSNVRHTLVEFDEKMIARIS